jgi:hypothetical protein
MSRPASSPRRRRLVALSLATPARTRPDPPPAPEAARLLAEPPSPPAPRPAVWGRQPPGLVARSLLGQRVVTRAE